MQLKVYQKLYTYEGEALPQGNASLTVRAALIKVLSDELPDVSMTNQEFELAFDLGIKLGVMGRNAGEDAAVELSPEEVVMLKKRVWATFRSPLIRNQLLRILDGKETGINPT